MAFVKHSKTHIQAEMEQRGATYSRIKFVETSSYWDRDKKEPFIEHFFNDDNTEVGYMILSENLYELTGAHYFENPRVWGLSFINHKLMGQPTDFINYCVKNLVNPLVN